MKTEQNTELFDACIDLMRSKTNKSIRLHLRTIGRLTGYTSVPGEESKVAAIKDWTAEIGSKFLFAEALRK